jgi:hypothetical protein
MLEGMDAPHDPEAWGIENPLAVGEPTVGELARRLSEVDVEVLRPEELVRFSLAAGQLAGWAEALRRAAEARLVALLHAP